MTSITYTQTPERLVRPAKPTTPYIPDIAAVAQLAKIAEQMLDERPGESVLIAQAPYFWNGKRTGSVWGEVERTYTNERTGLKMSNVRALSDRKMFEEYCGEGQWIPSSNTTVYANSLRHIAIVKDGEITHYMERPNLKLVPDIPDLLQDESVEGITEYRLQQQELAQEIEGEDEGALSNITQIEDNKFQATRPDGKVVTITIPVDDRPWG